jgi:ribosomal-protein-alanine N-acetyltransferase
MAVEIETERFILRELEEADVTPQYLSWFTDDAALKHIAAAKERNDLSTLRAYVRERVNRPDVLFLGIFERATGLHLGNIKYEPVDSEAGYAIMGIFIGEAAFRGKGVGPEVLKASSRWLHEHRSINQVELGVSLDNPSAIRAYEAAGFVVEETPHWPQPHPSYVTMVLHLKRT